MKNFLSKPLWLFSFFILVFSFTSCFSPLDYNSNDTTLSVILGSDNFDSSRNTIRNPSFLQYEVRFFNGPGPEQTKTGGWGAPITVRVEPGTWNVSVRAFDPQVPSITTVAFGFNTVDVRAGQSNTTTVQMIFEVFEALTAYINWAPGGTMDNPVIINLALELDNDNMVGILDAIEASSTDRYVSLNLLNCNPSKVNTGAGLRADGSFETRANITPGSLTLHERVVSITLPAATTSIAEGSLPGSGSGNDGVFFGFVDLNHVNLGNNITEIGANAFNLTYSLWYGGGEGGLKSIVIPNSVTIIGYRAFQNNQLTSVVIPNSVIHIASYAFYDNQLTSVIIGNNVSTIGVCTFLQNPLTSITIGSNVLLEDDYIIDGEFELVYNSNGKLAGTYTRPDENSSTWTYIGP